MPSNQKKENFTWIDSLKGIAICGVIMIHSDGWALPSHLGEIGSIGKNGVQLFFLISAFLTFISLEHYYANNSNNKISIKEWYIKKFIKLMPLFYLSILLCSIIQGGNSYYLGSEGKITIWNILAHIFFLHGLFPHYINSIIGVEWYIGTLVIFYILAPFLYKLINNLEKSVVAFLIISLLSTFINHLACKLISIYPPTDLYIYDGYFSTQWILAQLPVMLLGIVLYYLFKSGLLTKINNKAVFSYALLLFAAAMIGGQALGENYLLGLKETTLFGIWFFMIAVSQKIYGCPIIDNGFFRILGKYSYPIYLFHYLLIWLYNSYITLNIASSILNWLVKYIIVILSSLAISVLLSTIDKKIYIRTISIFNAK